MHRGPDDPYAVRGRKGSEPKLATRHGASEQTILTWRKRYGDLDVADVRRLRELEAESSRLKMIVGKRGLEMDVMKKAAPGALSLPTWRAVLETHANDLVSIDFFTGPTVRIDVLIVVAYERGWAVHLNVTARPKAYWTPRQTVTGDGRPGASTGPATRARGRHRVF